MGYNYSLVEESTISYRMQDGSQSECGGHHDVSMVTVDMSPSMA